MSLTGSDINYALKDQEDFESLNLTDAIKFQYAFKVEETYQLDLLTQFQQKLTDERVAMCTSGKGISSVYHPDKVDEGSTNAVSFPQMGIKPVLQLPKTAKKVDKFNSLQKWEGIILEVKQDYIVARLTSLGIPSQEEEAEIPLSELESEDLDLVEPGSVFYWNIGYLDTARGQRIRSSLIRFRRIPYITKNQIEGAAVDANKLRQFICWE